MELPEIKRKLVAILSADVQGYSRLMGDDEEATVETLTASLKVMSALIVQHRGRVVDAPGDNLLAEFPSAVDALRSAVAIQQELRTHNEKRPPHRRMFFRIGLNLGDVIVQGEDIYGDGVNIAARLEGLAQGGGICISGSIYDQVENKLDLVYEFIGEQKVKNITRPVRVYRVHTAVPPVVRSQYSVPSTSPPPPQHAARSTQHSSVSALTPQRSIPILVGRDVELEQLHACWVKALNGRRQIIFLSGEPGIGKTALVDAFVERVRYQPDIRITYGQCVEQYGAGEAYLPLLEATARLCREAAGERRIESLKRYAPSWLVQLPGLLTPEDRALLQQRVQGTNRERMLREMAETAELFTAQRGLIVVLEDVHWSDVSTLDWLTYMARRREPAKLFILATYRPADVRASDHPLRSVVQELRTRQQCEEIRLTPLGEEAIITYLEKRFGSLSKPHTLAGVLARRTGGNPLFIINTVDYLIKQDIITEEAGQWAIQEDKIKEINNAIPDTLRQLIEHQVDQLTEEDKRALEVASIAGVEFTVAEVAVGLAGDIEALEFQYERLARSGQFLRTEGVTEWPDGTLSGHYSFLHAVYHEGISARVGEARRIQLHRRIAERKEAAYGERTREVAAELAAHFEQGRDYAKAVQYRRQAGEAAARSGAPQEALNHLKRGLELLALLPDNPERVRHEVRLQLALTNPLYAIGGRTSLNEMEQAYLRAHALCQRLDASPQLASVLFGLGMVYELRGDVQKGLALAEQLQTIAQKEHNPALLLRAHMALGNGLYFLGEFAASHHHLEQGLAIYDPNKHSPRVSNVAQDLGVVCYSRAGWVLWCRGYPDQARRSSDRGLALAHELSHFLSEAFALDGDIGVAQECGELPIVEQRVARLITLSQEQGFLYPQAWGMILQGWLSVAQGKTEEGLGQLNQGLTIIRMGGQELGLPYFMGLLAEAYGVAGRSEKGLVVVAEALTIGQRCGERFYDAELYRLYGELLRSRRETENREREEAETQDTLPLPDSSIPRSPVSSPEEAFLKALTLARRQQAKSFELRAAMSLARLWRTQGQDSKARQLLEEVYGWFTEGFDTKDLRDAKALLQELGSDVQKAADRKQLTESDDQFAILPTQPSALSPQSSSALVFNPQHLSSPAPSVVGREPELAILHDRWDMARTGVRQAIFLCGEPGIGKTALTDSFLTQLRAQPDVWIAHGQCVEQYGAGEAYLPVLEALGRLGREPGKEEVTSVLAQYAPTWLAQLPALVPPAKREEFQRILASTTRMRMLRELVEALEVLSSQRLLVLVLEDLHWSDPSTVELLAYVLRRQGLARLFIIGTYRPAEILATDHPLKRTVQELQGRGHCEVLQLELLPEAAVAAYLLGRFGAAPTELTNMLHQRTEGNPLFMVATVEHLLREGLIVPEENRLRVTQDLKTFPVGVPENLRQLIATQLEGLRPEEQRLLEVASVVGAEFTVTTFVSELEHSRETLEAQCASLATRRQFIRAAGTEQSSDGVISGRYSFIHALYQRVIYEQIAEARRMQWHCRIGEDKEKRYGDRAPELASELAVHFEIGHDYLRAVHYFTLAGETAVRRHAHQEAITHIAKGLALLHMLPTTPERTQQELRLQITLGVSLIATQGWAAPQVEQAYTRALELCQHSGTTSLLFPVLRGLQICYMTRAEYAKSRQLAEQLHHLARQLQDSALLVGAHMAMGQTLFFCGEFVLARTHLEQGLALHQQQNTYQGWAGGHPLLSCLGYNAWTLWFLGYPDQALKMGQEALRLAREGDHPFALALTLQFAGKLHMIRREAQAAQERVEEILELSTTYGFISLTAIETFMHRWTRAEQGRRREDVAQMAQILSEWRTARMDFARAYYLTGMADIYGKMGQSEEGLQAVAEALALIAGNGERLFEAELYRLKGELTLQQFRLAASQHLVSSAQAEAEQCFLKALAVARQQQAKSFELRAAMNLAQLWRQQDKLPEARALLESIYSWFTEGFDTQDLQDAEALLLALGSTIEKSGDRQETKETTQSARQAAQGATFTIQYPEPIAAVPPPSPDVQTSGLNLSPQPPPTSSPAQDLVAKTQHQSSLSANLFQREGEYWTLVFQGMVARIKDTRGMQYLAYLLRHPDQEFAAIALATETPDFSTNTQIGTSLLSEARDPAAATIHLTGFTDAGEILDPQAKAAYRQRLKEIQDELNEAHEFNDIGRVEKLQDELEFVTQELTGAIGLRGRARKSASPQERARVNVTRAIRTAITRVTEAHPALGQYLTHTIKTGTFCVYLPDPRASLPWEF